MLTEHFFSQVQFVRNCPSNQNHNIQVHIFTSLRAGQALFIIKPTPCPGLACKPTCNTGNQSGAISALRMELSTPLGRDRKTAGFSLNPTQGFTHLEPDSKGLWHDPYFLSSIILIWENILYCLYEPKLFRGQLFFFISHPHSALQETCHLIFNKCLMNE